MTASIVGIADPHDEVTGMLNSYDWHFVRVGQMRHGEMALVASRRPADKDREPCAELLAAELLAELKTHCASLGGPQRYHVVLVDEEREVMAQKLITIHPDAVQKLGPPTTPALHASHMTSDSEVLTLALRQSEQAMAHNEAAWRMMAQNFKATMGTLASQMDEMRRRNEELERDRRESIRLREEALSKQHEREMAERKAERDGRFREGLVERLMEFAPYAIAHYSGGTAVCAADRQLLGESAQAADGAV